MSTAPLKKASAPTTVKTTAAKPAVKTTAPAAPKKAPAKATADQSVSPSVLKADKKKEKPEKVKVVRDSFTIPKTEYTQIAALKKRAMALGLEVKKSELIRAGLLLLVGSSDAAFRKAMGEVPTLKTGRPGKS